MNTKPPKLGGDECINERLAKKNGLLLTGPKLRPRGYQSELYLKALEQNVIVYLGTGLGKTFITVLFLQSPKIAQEIQSKRKVVFLAPTQDLVKQQADYINTHVNYRVKIYCGRSAKCGMHIDHWSKEAWSEEVENIDIMFMTPQIFSAAMSTNHLDWTQFSAIIFDEVHHACRNRKRKASGHPYVQTFISCKQFYQAHPSAKRPRFIGLTASLINSVPNNREDIVGEVKYLEDLVSAQCVTDVEVQDKRPHILIETFTLFQMSDYDSLIRICRTFKISLEMALKLKDANQLLTQKSYQLTEEQKKTLAFFNRIKLAASGFSIKPGSFPKVFEGLQKVRERCGLWMLRCVCLKLIAALGKHSQNTCLPVHMKGIYEDFTKIIQTLYAGVDHVLGRQTPREALTIYTRAKPMALLDVLAEEYKRTMANVNGKKSYSCIIFVQSRLEVVALTEWLQTVSAEFPEYNFIKCDYAIGIAATMTSKYSCITKRKSLDQYKMLEKFRKGDLNTIITTSVLEEGIDLPVCSTVIRYDIPNNFRQYIQSRGRARQHVSSMVFLCPSGKDYASLRDMLNKFNDFEITLKETMNDKTIKADALKKLRTRETPPEDKEDVISANDGRIRITALVSKTILNMYCSQLSKNVPFTEGVRYDRIQPENGMFQTILYLPSSCLISGDGIKGSIKSSEELADSSAIVEAVNFLRASNELNENFAPTRKTEQNVDQLLDTLGLAPKIEELDISREGIVKKSSTDEKETRLFEPILRQIPDYLDKNNTRRRYKLIKIKFESTGIDTREDTRNFFEKPVFGFIVDQMISSEFIPTFIYSHYGQFKVCLQETPIVDNSIIRDHMDHNNFLNYTHRLLTKCLSISHLKRDEFRYHTLFYLLPLTDDGKPDHVKIRSAFYGSPNPLKVGDIVRVNRIYSTDRRPGSNDRLLLIKNIHKDMNENSRIPGSKTTFLEDANYKFNGDMAIKRNQVVIEVIPISKDFGHVKKESAKRTREDYVSSSLYYLEQFLEHFDDDAYSVFQAYLMPEIIYRLYFTYMAQLLDNNFVQETAQLREKQIGGGFEEIEEIKEANGTQVVNCSEETEQCQSDSDDTDDSDSSTSDDEDGASDSDNEFIGQDYVEMVNKRTMDLNKNNDDLDDDLKRWDLSGYNPPDLKMLEGLEVKNFDAKPEELLDQTHFTSLEDTINRLTVDLIQQIQMFGKMITADNTFLDEDSELERRVANVDKTILPPTKFDRNTKPLKQGSRVKSLLEALTQRRAQEAYSLEGLENVGDSYLKYIVSVVLYSQLDGSEGFLTSARSRLTCNKYFTFLAKKKRLGSFAITDSFNRDRLGLFLGKQLDKDKQVKTYNRLRPKNLADTFEAIVGSYLAYHGEFEATLAIEWLGLNIFSNNMFEERHENAIVFAKAPTALIPNEGSNELLKSFKAKFHKLEKILGYQFNDSSYLCQAMSHASSLHKVTRSYERLEFLGDAILDYLVTMTLVARTAMNDPGQMTSSRSALVNNYNFAKLAIKYKYDLFIQHSSHQLYDELNKVRLAMEEDPEMSFLKITDFDQIVKLLADVFESVAGAIYLDSGCSLDTVWSIYYPMLKECFDKEIENPSKNYMMTLFESFPGPDRISFSSDEVQDEEGNLLTVVKCRVIGYDDVKSSRDFEGQGLNRRQAKQRAVEEAVRLLPGKEKLLELNKAYQELYSDKFNKPGRPRAQGGRGGGGSFRHRGGRGNYNSQRPNNSRPRSSSREWRR